jgi:hypothetical protein
LVEKKQNRERHRTCFSRLCVKKEKRSSRRLSLTGGGVSGIKMLRRNGATAQRRNGATAQRRNGATAQRRNGATKAKMPG